MRRHRYPGLPSPPDQRGQQQFEANQFDWLPGQQVAVLPEVARAVLDAGTVGRLASADSERRQRCQRGEQAVVLIAQCATPAPVGALVFHQPLQCSGETGYPSGAVLHHARQPGGVVGGASDAGPSGRVAQQGVRSLVDPDLAWPAGQLRQRQCGIGGTTLRRGTGGDRPVAFLTSHPAALDCHGAQRCVGRRCDKDALTVW